MAVKATGTKVRRSEIVPVPAQPIDGVPHSPQLETPGQFDPHAERAIEGDRSGLRRVADLRYVVREGQPRCGEKEYAPQRGSPERLHLHVAAGHVAGKRRAGRIRPE